MMLKYNIPKIFIYIVKYIFLSDFKILCLSYNHNDFNIILIFMSLNISKKKYILYTLLPRNLFPSDQYHSPFLERLESRLLECSLLSIKIWWIYVSVMNN
jgi:hypothetical protein